MTISEKGRAKKGHAEHWLVVNTINIYTVHHTVWALSSGKSGKSKLAPQDADLNIYQKVLE